VHLKNTRTKTINTTVKNKSIFSIYHKQEAVLSAPCHWLRWLSQVICYDVSIFIMWAKYASKIFGWLYCLIL